MTDRTQIERIINYSFKNIAGLMVQRDGKLLYEKYYNGFDKNSPCHIFSVTKSIVGILLGIAIDKGLISSVDEKIKEDITIRDIITMTAPYSFRTEPYEKYFKSPDWVLEAYNLLSTGKTGEFRYAPIIGPDIISGIISKNAGMSLHEFADRELFSHLGISVKNDISFRNKEEQINYYDKKITTGWVCDPKGQNTAGWGLSLTAEDMAKVGNLILNNGLYNGKRIVSSDWLNEMLTKQSYCKEFKLGYGYLWWVIDDNAHIYAAMGDSGNIIYINKDKKLVVAINSYFCKKTADRLKLIKDYIEPAFTKDQSL